MNKINVVSVICISVLFLCAVSCKDKVAQVSESNNKKDLPKVLQTDTLVDKTNVQIVDTFAGGKPMKVLFEDKQNKQLAYEKQYYESGNLFMEGAMENGRRTGKWTAYYENGMIWSIGYYDEGLRNGSSEVYYGNGQLRYTKNYEKDVAEGLWKFYNEAGNPVGEVLYENGKVLSQKEF